MERLGGDHLEAVVCEPGDGDVGHHPAALVHPLGVDASADRHGDVGTREAIQDPFGVGALDQELRHRGHVEQCDVLAHRAVFGRVVVEPVRATVRVPELDLGVGRREVGGVLPAR